MATEITLPRRKKRIVMEKEETLLLLRAYQSHPSRWADVLDEVKENYHRLPNETQELYRTSTEKQLRDRLSTKFGKLMSTDIDTIKDGDIRTEVQRIKDAERRHILQSSNEKSQQQQDGDRRDEIANTFTDENDPVPANLQPDPEGNLTTPHRMKAGEGETHMADPPVPSGSSTNTSNPRTGTKKRPLSDIIRQSHLAYQKFLTKKVPKLLRELGVSSSEEDD